MVLYKSGKSANSSKSVPHLLEEDVNRVVAMPGLTQKFRCRLRLQGHAIKWRLDFCWEEEFSMSKLWGYCVETEDWISLYHIYFILTTRWIRNSMNFEKHLFTKDIKLISEHFIQNEWSPSQPWEGRGGFRGGGNNHVLMCSFFFFQEIVREGLKNKISGIFH